MKKPDGDSFAYSLALRQAEEACRLRPNQRFYLNTLGLAQFRVSQYANAIESLTKADRFNGGIPGDLAFLAMSHHQLGQKDQAQKAFTRLREAMKQEKWSNDAEAQAFFRETEKLLQVPDEKSGR